MVWEGKVGGDDLACMWYRMRALPSCSGLGRERNA